MTPSLPTLNSFHEVGKGCAGRCRGSVSLDIDRVLGAWHDAAFMFDDPPVRIGIVGLGSFGRQHAEWIRALPELTLAATCDPTAGPLVWGPGVQHFASYRDLHRSGSVEAVLIASPHHTHAAIAADALAAGLHVLLEKPIARHLAEAQRLLASAPAPGQKFAVMLNQRMNPAHRRLKQLIEEQRLGKLQRIHWICTPWFRTQAYYRSAAWRGTWAGEGGGLLMTLCLHQLDILQWLCGLPVCVQAFGAFGKYHDIEVEDEVTAYMQFPEDASGVFVGSSGESPGTNRLELVGTGGRARLDDGVLSFEENEMASDEFLRTHPDGWARPRTRSVELPLNHGGNGEHSQILRNFARAIRGREELLTPAKAGLGSLELAGAMLLALFQRRAVELPLEAEVLETELDRRAAISRQPLSG